MGRPKRLLTTEDIEKLQSITRGNNTAAVGYRLAAVRAYTTRPACEVASFFDTKPETVIRWASKFHLYGMQGLERTIESGCRRGCDARLVPEDGGVGGGRC